MSFILVGNLPLVRTFRKPSYQGLKQYSNQLSYLFKADQDNTPKAACFVRLYAYTNMPFAPLINDEHEEITIPACFDSDRLDLGRVAIMPDADYLCTPMAKMPDTIKWGYNRSLVHELPDQPFGLPEYNDRLIIDDGF